LEEEVDLRALNFVGSLQDLHFPPNCLIFHLIDGMYALNLSTKVPEPKHGPTLPTSSYSALMRLATLDNSIQDALATREKLVGQINDLIAGQRPDTVPIAEDRVQWATKYVQQQRRAVKSAQKRCDELRASIDTRRAGIKKGRSLQEKAADEVTQAEPNLAESKRNLATTKESIHGQRRRICADLMNVFPITDVPGGQQLSFEICGLPLPNTTYDQALLSNSGAEDSLSAALGLVAQLTRALQFYLAVPLPYDLKPFGSRSSVRDDISILPDNQREFPLYIPRRGSGSAQYRFDYGWFLLNKDIEALCVSQGLRVVDIRHTLPNLKYLLYVASAGTDEVPERKRGGVRGLWAGRMLSRGMSNDSTVLGGSASGSRKGSAESETLAKQIADLRRTVRDDAGVNGQQGGSLRSKQRDSTSPVGLPFEDGEVKLTLRTKGLRENVVK
jgi:UV radiation resistance-associated gene protein